MLDCYCLLVCFARLKAFFLKDNVAANSDKSNLLFPLVTVITIMTDKQRSARGLKSNVNDYALHEAQTTSACSQRSRRNLSEVFASNKCFRNTACFRKCSWKIVRHSGLFY